MRFNNLQALRFAAALTTVLPHLGFYARHVLGMQGPVVDVLAANAFGLGMTTFYAMSGFVIAHSLRTTPPGPFLAWRLVRIYLPYWAASLVAFVTWQAIGRTPGHVEYRELWRGLILLPVGSYRASYLLFVEWTLVYEVYFSIAIALLALRGRRAVVAGSAAWLVAVIVATVLKADGRMVPQPTFARMGLESPIAPILFGVLAYEAFVLWPRAVRIAGPLAFFALWFAGRAMPRWDFLVIVQGAACAVLCAWCAAAKQLDKDNAFVRYGDWSYGVYLIHVPAIFAAYVVGQRFGWLPATGDGIGVVGVFALAVGLAYGKVEVAGYRWLQRRYAQPAATPARSAAAPLGVAA
jgi:peptidoglycan/LPS O-acetylase OafA/YrhL